MLLGLGVGLGASGLQGCDEPTVLETCDLDCGPRLTDGHAGQTGLAPLDAYFAAVLRYRQVLVATEAAFRSELEVLAREAGLPLPAGLAIDLLAEAVVRDLEASLGAQGVKLRITLPPVTCVSQPATWSHALTACDPTMAPPAEGDSDAPGFACLGRCPVRREEAISRCRAQAGALECVGATKNGACDGDCSGTCSTPSTSSRCAGTCTGTCDGTCDRFDAEGGCVGHCDGLCDGSCRVEQALPMPCEGRCDGTCRSKASGARCDTSTALCLAGATAFESCEGPCEGPLAPSADDARTLCPLVATARANMDAECLQAKIAVQLDREAAAPPTDAETRALSRLAAWQPGFALRYATLGTFAAEARFLALRRALADLRTARDVPASAFLDETLSPPAMGPPSATDATDETDADAATEGPPSRPSTATSFYAKECAPIALADADALLAADERRLVALEAAAARLALLGRAP